MAVASYDWFTSVSETIGGWDSWSNITNTLTGTSTYAYIGLTSGLVSKQLRMDGPISGGSVPLDAQFSNIAIEVVARHANTSSPGAGYTFEEVSIGNNLQKSMVIDTFKTEHVFSGDLAYWGITNSEVFEFINAASGWDFRIACDNNGEGLNNGLIRIYSIKAEFTYTTPTEDDIMNVIYL